MNISPLITAAILSITPATALANGLTIITPPAYGANNTGYGFGYTPSFGGPAGALATMPGPQQSPPPSKYKAPPNPGSMNNFDGITVKKQTNTLQPGQTITGIAVAESGNTISLNGISIVLSGVPNLNGYAARRRLSTILSTGQTNCLLISVGNMPSAECSILGQSVNSAMNGQ